MSHKPAARSPATPNGPCFNPRLATEIVTDNGAPYVLALDWLSKTYGIRHICISPYNSQVNGVVERRHFDVREAMVKSCEGEVSKWSEVAPTVFWAERVTIHKAMGFSPYYMAHSVHPRLPFDLVEATFLASYEAESYSTTDLIANRARQLQKWPEDLQLIHDQVLKSRFASAKDFISRFEKTIHDFDFKPGTLVIVRNSCIEKELDRKTKPHYLGPMVVVRRTKGSSYLLTEPDGTISKFRFTAFRLFPYFPRNKSRIEVTHLVGLDNPTIDRLEDNSLPDPELTGVPRDESDK
ncbi:hypothetical protein PISMIDRAFT_14386 [Pisolithus microcarpus 441]|uniref:Integrase catalytic domain-containing protein n=1 Tax=Pisolithus microcarpus 441 TaxID=765257 RepID=A0A0C9ZEM7_9AGAM|nr:hypothetical protein PISMIDRAFT_14386 [Pisolithus microcarpus 441]